MLRSLALAICFVCGCRNQGDLDFEIVKVPLTAYGDAAPHSDAAIVAHNNDGGHERIIVCIPKPATVTNENTEDDSNESDDACPKTHDGRNYDERVTERHRKNSDEGDVCCYRLGRVAPRVTQDDGE